MLLSKLAFLTYGVVDCCISVACFGREFPAAIHAIESRYPAMSAFAFP